MLLLDKYKPKTVKDIEGHGEAVMRLMECITKKRPCLIYGTVGCGKTSAVYAIANDMDYEVLEINASDQRNAEQINSILGNSLKQQSLFAKGKIVLIDEIDGLSGSEDRGGASAISSLLGINTHSIVLIANDVWDDKLKEIRKKCEMVEFKELRNDSVYAILKKICLLENIEHSDSDLRRLAFVSKSDIRAAITDLEVLSNIRKSIDKETISALSNRERSENIFTFLKVLFKSKDIYGLFGILDNLDLDQKEVMAWLSENLPLEYGKEDLETAYELLALADLFYSRIIKQQYWRYLVYTNSFLCGVSLAKKEKSNVFFPYRRSMKGLRIWQLNQKYAIRKSIASAMAEDMHCSSKKVINDILPYVKIICKNNKDLNLGLSGEEKAWLKSS